MSEFEPGAGPSPEPQPPFNIQGGPELPPAPETAAQALHEALESNYFALDERLKTSPEPTQQELEIGAFVEEIQPQARDAVLLMHQKGYDIGNVLHAGFGVENNESQGLTWLTQLSPDEEEALREHGFTIEDSRLSFAPKDPTNLGSIKKTWDWLADALPDRGEPAPAASFGMAVDFRKAAADHTLLDAYLPNGVLNMAGVKYPAERDMLADIELPLSPDVVSAARELTFVDRYHELKSRLAHSPRPTAEELNMGAYTEQLEPQVRDAVISMRRKGYNTGSSGFWGRDHSYQTADMSTYMIDDATRLQLAEYGVEVTPTGISFKPSQPSALDSVKHTWDAIANILPDLGKHASPLDTLNARVFRNATKHRRYDDYLETWLWQSGALSGHMHPLTQTLLREGYDFGEDVYMPARLAEQKYHLMIGLK